MSEQAQVQAVSEFRGEFPEVPLAPGVDPAVLEAGDADPFYVTLPVVPEVNTVSASGLMYDEALTTAIEAQINAKRPGGGFGHLSEAERETRFPHPEAFWVGARRVGAALWAKAYVPPGAAREHLRRLKAVGASISTSIFGRGEFEEIGNGVKRLRNFQLETVDFAPPERAALGYAAPVVVTAQMAQSGPPTTMRTATNKEQGMNEQHEVTLRDVPDAVRAQIVAEVEQRTHNRVAELEQAVADREAEAAELRSQMRAMQVREFESTVNRRVAALTEWGGDAPAVEALRRTLIDRIMAQAGEKTDGALAEQVADAVFAEMQPLVETVRDKLAGPPAVVAARAGAYRSGERGLDREGLAARAKALRKEHGI